MELRALAVICAALAVARGVGAALEDGEVSIHGMQGLRLHPTYEEDLQLLREYADRPGFDFTLMPRSIGAPVDVLVAPEELEEFVAVLATNGIRHEVFIEDMGKLLRERFAEQERARARSAVAGTWTPGRRRWREVSFKSFPTYEEITEYLESLAQQRPDIVELTSIGKSFEGRDIHALKISSGGEDKPAIVIDAGIHAREWIAPTTALYAIKQLAENASNSQVFDNVDFYVIPSLNPDGYAYSHRSIRTRMWRKTRSRSNSLCVGVDANRNFGYKWMVVGASSKPCSDTYAGTAPFSEPETLALRDFILSKKSLIKSYLTLHSYGNYLLHPWGFTEDLPDNEPTLSCVAKIAEKELSKVRGTRYTIGSSTNVLYPAAGGSDDWAMGVAGVDLVFTIELPGGRYGFAPPASEIIPVGVETFEAIRVFAKYVEGSVCQ